MSGSTTSNTKPFKVFPKSLLDSLVMTNNNDLIGFLEDNFLRYIQLSEEDAGSGPIILWREFLHRVNDFFGKKLLVFLIPNLAQISDILELWKALSDTLASLMDTDCIFLYVEDVTTWDLFYGADVLSVPNRYTYEVAECLSRLGGDRRQFVKSLNPLTKAKLLALKRGRPTEMEKTGLVLEKVVDVDEKLTAIVTDYLN